MIVDALVVSMGSIGYIGMILFLFLYVFAIMGTLESVLRRHGFVHKLTYHLNCNHCNNYISGISSSSSVGFF